ncbi:YraN family protein [Pilimelia anulata]|nr:YraN family protein [Pilimelia anulata]
MDKATPRSLGARGEVLAAEYLARAGLVIIERNWRCPDGEIDLIARDGPALAFIEVKTRRGVGYGTPAAAVDPRKAARLRRLAARWLATSGIHPPVVRFDVVAILADDAGPPRIEHRAGAF